MKQNTTPSLLPDQVSVTKLHNGTVYHWPAAIRHETETQYSRVAFLDDIVIKRPSSYCFSEYDKYVVREETDDDAIRGNEAVERFQNLDKLLSRYVAFRIAGVAAGNKQLHWLLLHMLQYDRLKNVIAIPETRFCFFRKRWLFFKTVYPGLVQPIVSGTSLWDMIDHERLQQGNDREPAVTQQFESLIPDIASQLRPLAEHSFACHVNWHIKNFTFDPTTMRLYYLDLKPSNIFGRWRNEQNFRNIRRDFLR